MAERGAHKFHPDKGLHYACWDCGHQRVIPVEELLQNFNYHPEDLDDPLHHTLGVIGCPNEDCTVVSRWFNCNTPEDHPHPEAHAVRTAVKHLVGLKKMELQRK